jgi:glycosyltransferase involved in cell wall biosynthesis
VPDVSIIIPCYNEEGGVEASLADLRRVMDETGLSYELLPVDDGSTDRTAEVLAGQPKPVKLLRNPSNLGYGASIKHGIRKARSPIVAITDADGTYPAEALPDLIKAVKTELCDMAVGARTGENVSIPIIRRPAKWALRMLANYVAGFPIPDINSGLRVFRREIAIRMMGVLPDGFSLTTTITLAMLTNGYQVDYQPIDYFKRIGDSKIRPIRDTANFTKLTVKMAIYFAPLKFFIPFSMGLLGLAIIWAGFSLFVLGKLADVSTLILVVASLQIGAIGLLAELINKRAPNVFRNEEDAEAISPLSPES